MLVAAAGFGCHVIAMALAPLSIVKPVIAGGLVFLAVLADRHFGHTVSRRQWTGIAFVALGLAMLAMTAPAVPQHTKVSHAGIVLFEGAIIAVGMLLLMIPRAGGSRRTAGLALGVTTGLLFGASDVAIKALTSMQPEAIVTSPWVLFCISCAFVAFLTGARSLQLGEAVPTIASTCLAANASTIAGGYLVFGDPLPHGTIDLAVYALGLLFIVGSSVMLPAPQVAVTASCDASSS
jgi:drug/metabolite transporter (DMT)-like permease